MNGETPPIGHNSFSKDQLQRIIANIENLEEHKATLTEAIRDVYGEAKVQGYDVKALRTIVRLRKMDAGKRSEEEAILDTYMQAIGMI